MEITRIVASDIAPIKKFDIQDIGNVLIIAGANGSGKTRLKNSIRQTFQNPDDPQLSLQIHSTRKEEPFENLSVKKGEPCPELREHMSSRTKGGTYTSTVIQIDSNRAILPHNFQPLNFSTPDPDDIEIDNRYYLNDFSGQWVQTVDKIFQKSASRRNKIASFIDSELSNGKNSEDIRKSYPDPFKVYQKLFSRLLPDKSLVNINPENPREFEYFLKGDNQTILPFSTLSSGEEEVIKIAFALQWKRISHSIFLIDEPELHLHPALSFRLIEVLKGMGGGTNQYIFFTHSADLISTYFSTGDVYFIDSDKGSDNQACRLSDLTDKHDEVANLIGTNLGIIAAGKKIVFIEGTEASNDRLTYFSIAQAKDLNLSFVPIGSIENLSVLKTATQQLQSSIYGVDFYLIRDRDGLKDEQIAQLEQNTNLRCLKRRHIENYFLDPIILSKVAERFCLDEKWKNYESINTEIIAICRDKMTSCLDLEIKNYLSNKLFVPIPRIKELEKKSLDDIQKEFAESTSSSVTKLCSEANKEVLVQEFQSIRNNLENSLNDNTWLVIFPGKVVFRELCNRMGVDRDRARQAYIEIAIETKSQIFDDIITIFKDFK